VLHQDQSADNGQVLVRARCDADVRIAEKQRDLRLIAEKTRGENLRAEFEQVGTGDFGKGSEWLWPSATSACGHAVEPKEMKRADLPSSHEYRHLARTLFIASGAPYAESAQSATRLRPVWSATSSAALLHGNPAPDR